MKYTELIKLGKSPTDGDSIIQDHSSFLTHCMTPHSQDNNVRFGVKSIIDGVDQSVSRQFFKNIIMCQISKSLSSFFVYFIAVSPIRVEYLVLGYICSI